MATGILALSLGLAGCGGQSSSLGTDAPSSGAGVATAASGALTGDVQVLPGEHGLSPEQFDAAVVTAPDQASNADTSGGAWRVIDVPAFYSGPSIVKTPSGWWALSNRVLGGKAISGMQSALYRSTDGVHWRSVALDPDSNDLLLNGLAYGAGRYVMVGTRSFSRGVVWSSSDGEHWTESAQPIGEGYAWSTVAFLEGRFFGLGTGYVGVSDTGERWAATPINMTPIAAAYGNGRYLLVGSGPMLTSEDGQAWQEHPLDCALPQACITDPSGGIHPGFHTQALFAEGRFFSEELSSLDGASWTAEPGHSPITYVSGHFLGQPNLWNQLATWTLGGPAQTLRLISPYPAPVPGAGPSPLTLLDGHAPLPEAVDVPFDDGLTCDTADCVVVGGRLLLVPPPGTPPLVDHVPRDAEGDPLLTFACPVSSTVFCSDYAARSGCECHPNAPAVPEDCGDVSHYRCAGQFLTRPGEWQLDEIAQAGCTCDAVDPNQPVGFGTQCAAGTDTCQAPFECLGIDLPPSEGPVSQPFVCTSHCSVDTDCPSWQATGFCSGQVDLRCSNGTCQPRACD